MEKYDSTPFWDASTRLFNQFVIYFTNKIECNNEIVVLDHQIFLNGKLNWTFTCTATRHCSLLFGQAPNLKGQFRQWRFLLDLLVK